VTAGVLSGRSEIRADAKSHSGKIYTKVSSARGAENFMHPRHKAEPSRRQSCFDSSVYGYSCASWLSWNSCSRKIWLKEVSEFREQHEAESSWRQAVCPASCGVAPSEGITSIPLDSCGEAAREECHRKEIVPGLGAPSERRHVYARTKMHEVSGIGKTLRI
jgi:hypothetical protein